MIEWILMFPFSCCFLFRVEKSATTSGFWLVMVKILRFFVYPKTDYRVIFNTQPPDIGVIPKLLCIVSGRWNVQLLLVLMCCLVGEVKFLHILVNSGTDVAIGYSGVNPW